MKFSSYLSEDRVITNLKGDSFQEIISNLLSEVAKKNKIVKFEKDIMLKAILKREEETSTYIGNGVALPHARLEYCDDIIVSIGIPEKPFFMNDGNNEKKEVKIFILIIADVLKNKNILKIMSGISRLCMKNKNILDEIILCKDSKKIIELLEKTKIEVSHNIIADDLCTQILIPAKCSNTLDDIAKRIIMEKVSGIPVVDNDNNFLGEITERELISFGMPKYTKGFGKFSFITIGEPFENYLVNEKMTTIESIYRKDRVVTVDKKASLMEISYLFINKGVTRIYVVENRKYIGVIFRSDIIKKILHI